MSTLLSQTAAPLPLELLPRRHTYAPLDQLTVRFPAEVAGKAARCTVFDAAGRAYFQADPGQAPGEVAFTLSGALGTQLILLADAEGRTLALQTLRLATETDIDDSASDGRFRKLFHRLYDTMEQDWFSGYQKSLRIHGKRYRYYVSWLRDHVHALKGMKYFDHDVKTGIELYADSQRDDGMIWDKCKKMLHSDLQNYRDYEFAEGDFIRHIPGHPQRRWQRVPVENDVEYLFLEGLYYTWKACGDTDWMARHLDHAIRAVGYATSDAYRWSEKFQLLKRAYTIDTWDFQHADDMARTGAGTMRVYLDKTVFGVMHGDNTGMGVGCFYLAEMLEAAGRSEESGKFRQLGQELFDRLKDLAWNGQFYTHHVSEDPGFKRDVGDTDESAQVTQSNAYALNRRLPHEMCTAIIQTYQRLRQEMPATSAGEFYSCWPPFENGFGRHGPGDYMNGGVTTICAGELAHGAFEHGYEAYGVDILSRLYDWSEKLGGYLHCNLRGFIPEPPERTFTNLDLRSLVNADYHGDGAEGVPGWIGGGKNDMSGLPTGPQTFEGVDFDVIDPASNGRRAVLGLSPQTDRGFAASARIPVNAKAGSVYFLHAYAGDAPGGLVGTIRVHYDDGTNALQYVHRGEQIENWFMPAPNDPYGGGNKGNKAGKHLRVAWQGPNRQFENVGLHLYGWNNPNPDKTIAAIELAPAESALTWMVGGITLSDAPVYFRIGPISYGIPDIWGCGALMYALIEGLAGIVDAGVGYDKLRLAPRWSAAGVHQASATATTPASGGYARYTCSFDQATGTLKLNLATNAAHTDLRLLLPEGRQAISATVNGQPAPFDTRTIESSTYAVLQLDGVAAWEVLLEIQ